MRTTARTYMPVVSISESDGNAVRSTSCSHFCILPPPPLAGGTCVVCEEVFTFWRRALLTLASTTKTHTYTHTRRITHAARSGACYSVSSAPGVRCCTRSDGATMRSRRRIGYSDRVHGWGGERGSDVAILKRSGMTKHVLYSHGQRTTTTRKATSWKAVGHSLTREREISPSLPPPAPARQRALPIFPVFLVFRIFHIRPSARRRATHSHTRTYRKHDAPTHTPTHTRAAATSATAAATADKSPAKTECVRSFLYCDGYNCIHVHTFLPRLVSRAY